jgi:hypothetical protein
MNATKNLSSWDHAGRLDVVRGNSHDEPANLEPGVKFFVLMIEQLGGKTLYSCEGHPDGFYVTFQAPHALALRIARPGYLDVSIVARTMSPHTLEWEFPEDRWLMELRPRPCSLEDLRQPTGEEREQEKIETLRRVAEAWEEAFGPLVALSPKTKA